MKGSLRIALGYLVFGLLWVLFTDRLAAGLPYGVQTVKAWVFVGLSALLVYALARRQEERHEAELRAAKREREALALFQKLTETTPAVILLWQDEHLVFANPEALRLTGYTLEELKARPIWDFVHPEDRDLVRQRGLARLRGEEALSRYTFRVLTKGGEVRWLDYSAAQVEVGGRLAVLGIGLDVTASEERRQTLEALARVNRALRESEDLETMMKNGLDAVLEALKAPAGSLLLYDPGKNRVEALAARGFFQNLPPPHPQAGLTGLALKGEVVVALDLREDPRVHPESRPHIPPGWSGVVLPLPMDSGVIGVLSLAWPAAQAPSPAQVEQARVLAQTLGVAAHRASLRRRLKHQLENLESLRTIDQAIASSLNLRVILEILLTQLLRLPLDAVALFLYDPARQSLSLEAARGFRSYRPLWPTHIPLSQESHIGQAALTGKPVHVPDLRKNPGGEPDFTLKEGLVAERAYPLLAKGRLLGVLAVFTRRPWDLSRDEEAFLEAIADQAAVALDNAQTYQEVLESRRELALTYDLTLWAWAKAVELRDQETGGHTERVVGLGVRLAQALGLKGEELEDFRRGAILHDVGKIAIPDAILKKPGPLTEEEWQVMRLHPVYAYEWLKGIPHLRRALEIPYAHHERWNGSGYPQGLKGEAIPFAARIFAVVDVYDALTSDRPYRKAWPREKAVAYLKEEAGRTLDPEVVQTFLALLAETTGPGEEGSGLPPGAEGWPSPGGSGYPDR